MLLIVVITVVDYVVIIVVISCEVVILYDLNSNILFIIHLIILLDISPLLLENVASNVGNLQVFKDGCRSSRLALWSL